MQIARRVEAEMIKVCIIEDEPEICKLLRLIIEKQDGFQVVSESENFAQAVSDFSRYRPDVAFVDIDLNLLRLYLLMLFDLLQMLYFHILDL